MSIVTLATAAPGPPSRRDRGAALVEFALLLPVLMCLLLGMITGGFALSSKNSMTNAVREGTRLGATLPEGSSWNSWATVVRDRIDELTAGDLNGGQICVEMVEWTGGSETVLGSWPTGSCPLSGGEPSVPPGTPEGSCVVKAWGRRTAELDAFFFQRDLTLSASAVGRYERAECP